MLSANSVLWVLRRGLRTGVQLSRSGCEGRSRHPDHRKALCQELGQSKCGSGKKKKPKKCDKEKERESRKHAQEECDEGDGHGGGGLPEMCTKQMAEDCARRILELQKQWEAVARQVERAQEAAELAGKKKKISGCPVKPPKKEEPPKSNLPVILGFLAAAAALGYYLYTQAQEGEGEGKGEDEEGGSKEEEKTE